MTGNLRGVQPLLENPYALSLEREGWVRVISKLNIKIQKPK
jgi:hypothetical protein